MKGRSRAGRSRRTALALALALAAAAPAVIAADAATRWVHGSWVHVRAAATAGAPVRGQVTANTPVRLLRQQDSFCEIGGPGVPQGFLPCRLLGAQPLDLARIGTPYRPDGGPNPDYSAPRAFWVAPSVSRLTEAGEHFWQTLLSADQRRLERLQDLPPQESAASAPPAPRLLRYAVPEFEAMKALLKAGVVAAPEQAPPPLPWRELRARVAQGQGILEVGHFWFGAEERALLRQAEPRPARPSLFRQAGELAGPSASVEALSARFGVKERIRILRGPRWGVMEGKDFIPMYDGAWDIGQLEAVLEQPVVEHAIGRQGLLSAAGTRAAQVFHPNGGSVYCTEGFVQRRRGEQALPGRPRVKDALWWFYTAAPLPYTQVTLQSRRIALPPPAPGADEAATYRQLVMHEIDLDGDAAADLAVWEGWRPPMIGDGGEPRAMLKLAFVNLAGQWHLLDAEHAGECT